MAASPSQRWACLVEVQLGVSIVMKYSDRFWGHRQPWHLLLLKLIRPQSGCDYFRSPLEPRMSLGVRAPHCRLTRLHLLDAGQVTRHLKGLGLWKNVITVTWCNI